MVGLWVGNEQTNFVQREVLRFSLATCDDRQEWLSRRRVVQPEVSWSRWLADGDQRDGM